MNNTSTKQAGGPSNHQTQETCPLAEKSKSEAVDGYFTIATPDKNLIVSKSTEAGINNEEERETWGKKVDFLLSIIGFAVDLANVWRFPYLCFKNGGGAFLIPYFLMLLLGGIPLFFMELVLGQFHRKGAISVWKISPIFKGIGMAECLIAYLVAFYYNVIIAWSVFYLIASFQFTLPWTSCDNDWNSQLCVVGDTRNVSLENRTFDYEKHIKCIGDPSSPNSSVKDLIVNGTPTVPLFMNQSCAVQAADEYFERRVLGLHLSDGITDLGPPRWQLVLCLFCVFTLLYFSLWKGVKSSGKVVWVTATMPYVVLTILFIRGLFLPGALEGIRFFVYPDFDMLKKPEVWAEAAVQIFYSVGAGFGVHIAYASYNKFTNNCFLDCIATASVNSFTSLYSGLVVFCYLGFMAQKRGTDIRNIEGMGPGLVFKVYPEAISTLPGSFIWSIIFFIMLLTLGLDSAMGGLEAVITGLRDELSALRKYKYSREILTFFVVFSAGLFAVQNVTNGGIYLFTMWDNFAAGTSLLLAVFSQAIAIGWFYGLNQFCQDIKKMLGFTPPLYFLICWKFISPLFLLTVITASIVFSQPLEYGTYVFPGWANGVGWLIAVTSMSLIPGYAIYLLIKTPGSLKQRIAICISPYWEHESIKAGEPVTRFQLSHWFTLGRHRKEKTVYTVVYKNGVPV